LVLPVVERLATAQALPLGIVEAAAAATSAPVQRRSGAALPVVPLALLVLPALAVAAAAAVRCN
jgi:hypothetical protein